MNFGELDSKVFRTSS